MMMLDIRLEVANSTRGSKRPVLAFIDADGNMVVEVADIRPTRERLVADWLAEAHRCMEAEAGQTGQNIDVSMPAASRTAVISGALTPAAYGEE
jgi:hypothetical protein